MKKWFKANMTKTSDNQGDNLKQPSGQKGRPGSQDFAASTKLHMTPEKQIQQYEMYHSSSSSDKPILSNDEVHASQLKEKQQRLEQEEWNKQFEVRGKRWDLPEQRKRAARDHFENRHDLSPEEQERHIMNYGIIELKSSRMRDKLERMLLEIPGLKQAETQKWCTQHGYQESEMTHRLQENILKHKIQVDFLQWEEQGKLSPELQIVLRGLSPKIQDNLAPNLRKLLQDQQSTLPSELHNELQELVPRIQESLEEVQNNNMKPAQQDTNQLSVLESQQRDLDNSYKDISEDYDSYLKLNDTDLQAGRSFGQVMIEWTKQNLETKYGGKLDNIKPKLDIMQKRLDWCNKEENEVRMREATRNEQEWLEFHRKQQQRELEEQKKDRDWEFVESHDQ